MRFFWHREGKIVGVRFRKGFGGAMVLQVRVEMLRIRIVGYGKSVEEPGGFNWRDARANDMQEVARVGQLIEQIEF